MKRWKKILLAVLAALILIIAALAIWQRNNIEALYAFAAKDSQQIAQELGRQRQEHQQAIAEQAPITVTPPSTQQSNDILSGAATAEQVKQELGIAGQLDKAGSEITAEEVINTCVAELYACKVDIMAELAELKQAALATWNGLPDDERTDARLRQIGLEGLEACYDLEVAVDDQVQQILSSYRTRLKALDADTAILDTLWEYYCDEKAAEKAYYLDKYLR